MSTCDHTVEQPTADDDGLIRWQELEDIKFRASLIQCRIAAGITVEDLSRACGLHPDSVRRIEDFAFDPHLSTLRCYAVAMGAVVHHNVEHVPKTETVTAGEELAQ